MTAESPINLAFSCCNPFPVLLTERNGFTDTTVGVESRKSNASWRAEIITSPRDMWCKPSDEEGPNNQLASESSQREEIDNQHARKDTPR